jgi:small subunit ribosomal protein S4
MARYTGPKVKISRRLGVNIFENDKGAKALNKRPYPPGEHGRSRRRQPSEYLLQLQEKQTAKYIYGVQARQFTCHGMINVNGKRVDIPSYRVRKGDVISLREKPRQMIVIRHNLDTIDRLKPSWIEVGDGGFQVTINDLPTRSQIDVPVREQLIVELYSK